MDRGAWQATVHGVARVGHDLAAKPPPQPINNMIVSGEQPRDLAIHIHGSILPKLPSHAGCCITLSRVP